MSFKQFFCFIQMSLYILPATAMVGMERLEKKLFENNTEILSLRDKVQAKESLVSAAYSGFYPSLNAVAGWGQNKLDELSEEQKGRVGYFEGKLNLFRGFKDQVSVEKNNTELGFAKNELAAKQKDLRIQLVSVLSDMIQLHKNSEILIEELKFVREAKQMAAKKLAAGLTGQVDNIEFELRETEIESELRQNQQRHEEAHQNLKKLLAQDIGDEDLNGLDFESFDKVHLQNYGNSENYLPLQKMHLEIQQIEQNKKDIKADFLPSLDLTYSFGKLTPNNQSPDKFDENRYAVLLTIPLFSGMDSYYKTKAASSELLSAEKDIQLARLEFDTRLSILKGKIEENKVQFNINERKLAHVKKYFDLTLAEYRRGIKNSPDLSSASERYYSSKKRKIEIQKELEMQIAELSLFD